VPVRRLGVPQNRAGRLLVAIAAVIGLVSCDSASPTTPSHVQPISRAIGPSVAIISIDGLRPDAITDTLAPNMRALARRGAYSWTAQTILPSTTLASHVSMLTGFTPDVHGMTWDDYTPSRRMPVPTVFAAARARGLRTGMIAGKDKFRHFRDTGSLDFFLIDSRGDVRLAEEAAMKAAFDVDLLFIHLPDVDQAGHAGGWMSPRYLAVVDEADRAVGAILGSLPESTTVLLTADHGGRGGNHGTAHPLETTIPWIVSGPRTFKGRQLSTSIRTVDTAATVAYLLGVTLPPGASGRAVTEAFNR
jgi:predicted AlkP superfamily pyrophosphatase or phosphodiesterase